MTAGARYRRPLLYAFLLTTSFVAVEFVAGIISGSLALLSDAGHMLSDAGGLGMSLAAITLATGGAAAAHRTYGWYRLEILASLANTALLFAVAGYVVYEAIQRLAGHHEVASTPMIVVAVRGPAHQPGLLPAAAGRRQGEPQPARRLPRGRRRRRRLGRRAHRRRRHRR